MDEYDVAESGDMEELQKPFKGKKNARKQWALGVDRRNNRAQTGIVIRNKGSIRHIPFSEIVCFESNLRKIRIVMAESDCEIYGKLNEIEALNLPMFCRCHQSYLVNLALVAAVETKQFVMRSGHCIPIAQRKYVATRAYFEKWLVNSGHHLVGRQDDAQKDEGDTKMFVRF